MPRDSEDATAALWDEAENTIFQRVDSAALMPRPAEVGQTWKEAEFDARADEQQPLFQADGLEASRQPFVEAAGIEFPAETASYLARQQRTLLDQSKQRLSDTVEALGALRSRGPKAALFYYLRTTAFLLGDIAGISGASISLGELPVNAYILAISAATATVVAGLAGKHLKITRDSLRRKRDPETLTKQQQAFGHLFTGADQGAALVQLLVWIAATIAVLVGAGIFALRAATEGSLSGLVYGAFALAIALGSGISSFVYADEIADQLDMAETDYFRALNRQRDLAAAQPLRLRGEKTAEVTSLREEHALRAAAARRSVTGLKWRILARNPGTVGHGPGPHQIPLSAQSSTPRSTRQTSTPSVGTA